jgi:hypothetical protein
MDTAVDAAAMQLMSKAMKFISLEDSPPPSRTSPEQRSSRRSPSSSSHSPSLTKPDASTASSSSSFFDKGLDAFGSMGKFVEGFAVTLDTVIGQAFEDWGTPKAPGREGKKKVLKPVGMLPSPTQLSPSSSEAPAQPAARGRNSHQWGDFDVEEEHNGELGGLLTPGSAARSLAAMSIAPASAGGGRAATATPGAPAASPYTTTIPAKGQTAQEIQLWRRRAQILQKELQKLRAQRDEYQQVKAQYETLQLELKNKATNGGDSNTNTGESNKSVDAAPGGADSLASEQVMGQMEALIAEKARLAQENDRLLRENNGLHELLEFTMQQHVADLGDDELFADENYLEEGPEEGEEEGFIREEESFETAEGGNSPANEL